jgi:hypothetical protein
LQMQCASSGRAFGRSEMFNVPVPKRIEPAAAQST